MIYIYVNPTRNDTKFVGVKIRSYNFESFDDLTVYEQERRISRGDLGLTASGFSGTYEALAEPPRVTPPPPRRPQTHLPSQTEPVEAISFSYSSLSAVYTHIT